MPNEIKKYEKSCLERGGGVTHPWPCFQVQVGMHWSFECGDRQRDIIFCSFLCDLDTIFWNLSLDSVPFESLFLGTWFMWISFIYIIVTIIVKS